jgi:hypothetical protein
VFLSRNIQLLNRFIGQEYGNSSFSHDFHVFDDLFANLDEHSGFIVAAVLTQTQSHSFSDSELSDCGFAPSSCSGLP